MAFHVVAKILITLAKSRVWGMQKMVAPVILSANSLPLATGSVDAPVPTARIDAFEQALARQTAEPPVAPVHVAQAEPVSSVTSPTATDIGADERARQGLGLDGVAEQTPPSAGDMILDGMKQLRGIFDVREAHIAELMSSQTVNANTLMAMQMEVANFTLLVDISSKLTGKTTQALDTLMKGQ